MPEPALRRHAERLRGWLRSPAARGLQIAVTLALLGWILASLDSRAWQAMRGIGPPLLGAAVVLFASAQIFGGLRLALLLPGPGLWREALAATWVGYFWSNFLPGTVGGDVVRGFRLNRAGISLPAVGGALLLDRLLNLAAVVAILLASAVPLGGMPAGPIGLGPALPAGLTALAALAASAAIAWVALAHARLPPLVLTALAPLRLVVRSPLRLGGVVLLSFLSLGVAILAEWLIARRLGLGIGPAGLANIICLVTIIVLLPVSLNGLGLQEASFVVLLMRAGAPAELALSFSLLARVLIVGAGLIAGLVVVADRLAAVRRARSA